MSESVPENIPVTLFEKDVFQSFRRGDFLERLTFRTLSGVAEAASEQVAGKDVPSAAPSFQKLFEYALSRLAGLREQVHEEVQTRQNALAAAENRLHTEIDSARRELEGILQ
eukprot:RCo044069